MHNRDSFDVSAKVINGYVLICFFFLCLKSCQEFRVGWQGIFASDQSHFIIEAFVYDAKNCAMGMTCMGIKVIQSGLLH